MEAVFASGIDKGLSTWGRSLQMLQMSVSHHISIYPVRLASAYPVQRISNLTKAVLQLGAQNFVQQKLLVASQRRRIQLGSDKRVQGNNEDCQQQRVGVPRVGVLPQRVEGEKKQNDGEEQQK